MQMFIMQYKEIDRFGSTKIIISNDQVINRIEYDQFGKIRNKETEPQIDLLWKGLYLNNKTGFYIANSNYNPKIGYDFAFSDLSNPTFSLSISISEAIQQLQTKLTIPLISQCFDFSHDQEICLHFAAILIKL